MVFEDWDNKRKRCTAKTHSEICGMLFTVCEVKEAQALKLHKLKTYILITKNAMGMMTSNELQEHIKYGIDSIFQTGQGEGAKVKSKDWVEILKGITYGIENNGNVWGHDTEMDREEVNEELNKRINEELRK